MRPCGTKPRKAFTGVLLLCVHLLSCTDLAALIFALTAAAGGDHRILIANSGDAVQLRLSHSPFASKAHAAHCHCLFSRVVVAFTEESGQPMEDHIVTFHAHGWSAKVEIGSSSNLDQGETPLPLVILSAQFLDGVFQSNFAPIAYSVPSIPSCGIEVCQSTVMLI